MAESASQDQNSEVADEASESEAPHDLATLQAALELNRAGVWSWDLRSNQLAWSTQSLDADRFQEGRGASAIQHVSPDKTETNEGWLATLIRQASQSGKPARLRHRISATPDQPDGWIEVAVTPIVERGATAQILGVCRNATEPMYLRSRQQQALARLSERALVESNIQLLFDDAVIAVGDILGVELVKVLELLPGDGELLLRAGIGWQPGLVGHAIISTAPGSQAGYTLAAGQPVIVEDLAFETRFVGQPILHTHGAVSGISVPIAGQDGRAYGVITAHSPRLVKFHDYDASFLTAVANVLAGAIRRSQLDHRHEMMIRELRHRSGNIFAQLLALFGQTAKNSRNMRDLATKFEGRVLAMATAHRLVTEGGWTPTSLIRLLGTLFAPHLSRVTFRGSDVLLEPDPAFGLSMALHELLTNAGQHGSLASPDGHVAIDWTVTRTSLGLTLNLEWKETGGDAPKRNPRNGFGLRVVKMAIERQLNGQVEQTFASDGVAVRLTVPLTQDRWSQFGTTVAGEPQQESAAQQIGG